jgi:hypothetical protein
VCQFLPQFLRTQCSSFLASPTVPHTRADLATQHRGVTDQSGPLCEVIRHAEACAAARAQIDHPASLGHKTLIRTAPETAARKRGLRYPEQTYAGFRRAPLRNVASRGGLRDTVIDGASHPYEQRCLLGIRGYFPNLRLPGLSTGAHREGVEVS